MRQSHDTRRNIAFVVLAGKSSEACFRLPVKDICLLLTVDNYILAQLMYYYILYQD